MSLRSPILLTAALACGVLGQAPAGYTVLPNTDTPAVYLNVQVGNCGSGGTQPCNASVIAAICDATCGCAGFNCNGWLKSAPSVANPHAYAGCDTYVRDAGPAPGVQPLPAIPYDDWHYPAEEAAETAIADASLPSVVSMNSSSGCAELLLNGSSLNACEGDVGIFTLWTLQAVLSSPAAIVLETNFARWSLLVALDTTGEVARWRAGVGQPPQLVPRLYVHESSFNCRMDWDNDDYLFHRIVNDTVDGEANFTGSAAYMTPIRDYAVIAIPSSYDKWVVSWDGRIKRADEAVYVPSFPGDNTGYGTVVFDPATVLSYWPANNFTVYKSALYGGHLLIVGVHAWDASVSQGFEMVAFAPSLDNSSQVFVRVREWLSANQSSPVYSYFNVSNYHAPMRMLAAPFYAAMFDYSITWATALAPSMAVTLPAQEGARQVDNAVAAMVTAASVYIGLSPNYGTGNNYWSVIIERGSSLPLTTLALDNALLEWNLVELAAARVGFYLDAFMFDNGTINMQAWEYSCSPIPDALADYGKLLLLFTRTSLAVDAAGINSTWTPAYLPKICATANYVLGLRANATNAFPPSDPRHGMVFGPPEHDTCHAPGYFFNNQVWLRRGMREAGKFLTALGSASGCPSIAAALLQDEAVYVQDIATALNVSMTRDSSGNITFVAPVVNQTTPFIIMTYDTPSMYANFRYFAEQLSGDGMSGPVADALMQFRENTGGSIAGITRWSDHLDDMPADGYAWASLSRYQAGHFPRFLALLYSHMANYGARGVFTATEQLSQFDAGNAQFREVLTYTGDPSTGEERDIDYCVPSATLVALATKWQLLLESFDEDVLQLAAGAPRRWFGASGFQALNIWSKYGSVNLTVSVSGTSGVHEVVIANVGFTQWTVATAPAARPLMVLRLRASVPTLTLQSPVTVSGDAALVTQDAGWETVTVNMTTSANAVFTVVAVFQ